MNGYFLLGLSIISTVVLLLGQKRRIVFGLVRTK